MVTDLDAETMEAYLAEPGVALLTWRSPLDAHTVFLDRTLESLSHCFPETRFGRVDVTVERRLAAEWAVSETPTWMAYRDGALVFSHTGAVVPEILEGLLVALGRLPPPGDLPVRPVPLRRPSVPVA